MVTKYTFGILALLLVSVVVAGQYEQKVSIDLSAGVFKTVGYAYGENEPSQMPNYGIGLSTSGGVHFRISERFTLAAELGYKVSQSWSYEDEATGSYFYWLIEDSITGDKLVDGENYLDLFNYSIGIKPIYYLSAGNKWNPFLFTGINFNYTTAYFEDSYWLELEKRNMLPPEDDGPTNEFLESNLGLGLNPGIGVELSPGGRMHYYLTAGYQFIWLHWSNFTSSPRNENFHALVIQVGTRINFLKTKDL